MKASKTENRLQTGVKQPKSSFQEKPVLTSLLSTWRQRFILIQLFHHCSNRLTNMVSADGHKMRITMMT